MSKLLQRITAVLLVLLINSFAAAQQSPTQRIQAIADKGLAFLKSAQQKDGGWQATADEPPGITAMVLKAFAIDPKYTVDKEPLKKGYEKLLSYQKDDGGIYVSAQANYNTSIALVALAGVNNPAFKSRIDKAIAFLRKTQWTETAESSDGVKVAGPANPWYGGWGYATSGRGLGRPDLSNVQMVLDALHDSGLKPDDPAFKAALVFLTRSQNHSETNDLPWAGNDGGFIYSVGDGGAGSSAAGGYTSPDGKPMLRSYGTMTYAGLKSLIYAGLTKDDSRVKAAWSWVTANWTVDENPGMKAGNPSQAQYGLYYYFSILSRALNAYDQPVLTDAQGKQHDWRIEVINKLASLQKPDGSWVGEQRWMENNPVLTTAYCLIALDEIQHDLHEHPPAE